jgi:hypothetical protein
MTGWVPGAVGTDTRKTPASTTGSSCAAADTGRRPDLGLEMAMPTAFYVDRDIR